MEKEINRTVKHPTKPNGFIELTTKKLPEEEKIKTLFWVVFYIMIFCFYT